MKGQKVIARIIIEVLGSPKEHVESTLKQVIDKLKEEPNIRLIRQTTYEAEQQDKTKLWSAFSEIELQADNVKKLMELCFDYMPSTIEIIEPAGMEIDTSEIADLLNDLMARLHRYDMVLKNIHAENLTMKHDLELIKQAAKKAVEAKKSETTKKETKESK